MLEFGIGTLLGAFISFWFLSFRLESMELENNILNAKFKLYKAKFMRSLD